MLQPRMLGLVELRQVDLLEVDEIDGELRVRSGAPDKPLSDRTDRRGLPGYWRRWREAASDIVNRKRR
jgi:hypothetical protein